MKDHVTGVLRWGDFVAATLRTPLDGAAMLENFRAVFAASLGLDASSVTLFGSGRRQGVIEASSKQAARTITNEIVRGILGGLFGGKKR